MRMISGLLAPQTGSFTLIGDESLSAAPWSAFASLWKRWARA